MNHLYFINFQITCAAAVVDACQSGLPDLWICSSDGYVGQVCVLTFQNEPVIASSVNICNARILCITAVPGVSPGYSSFMYIIFIYWGWGIRTAGRFGSKLFAIQKHSP